MSVSVLPDFDKAGQNANGVACGELPGVGEVRDAVAVQLYDGLRRSSEQVRHGFQGVAFLHDVLQRSEGQRT